MITVILILEGTETFLAGKMRRYKVIPEVEHGTEDNLARSISTGEVVILVVLLELRTSGKVRAVVTKSTD